MKAADTGLFAPLTPYRQGWLSVGHGHRLHWQLSGNPKGHPVLWIHGGPGSSASALHRRFLDPYKYLIIQYDQRGCGRSQPQGEIRANTTEDLLADIECLRASLDISRWDVVGGSWGGSLALLYTQSHPEVIGRMLLRSPFLCTDQEIGAYLNAPPPSCQPLWDVLVGQISRQECQGSLLTNAYRVFCGGEEGMSVTAERARLARAWAVYEAALDNYPAPWTQPTPTKRTHAGDQALIARYRVHLHYLWHRCFVDRPIVNRPDCFNNLDLTLVHGDEDALCPFTNSLEIQRLVPHAKLVRVAGAGHQAFDARMVRAVASEIQSWT